jgi:ferredoxin
MAVSIDNTISTGCGSCVEDCMLGALSVIDGMAVVDPDSCVECGKTVERREWVVLEKVFDELHSKLAFEPDYITLGGSGEPTLYSRRRADRRYPFDDGYSCRGVDQRPPYFGEEDCEKGQRNRNAHAGRRD